MPQVISLNVGLPQNRFLVHGQPVATGIYKQAVYGPVALRGVNLEGDGQADRQNHGGPEKAVYGYPSEHYPYWQAEFPDLQLPWGMFGENLTTQGLTEDQVYIGDRFRIGSAVVEVVQPRFPCSKLAMKFGAADMVRRFLHSERSGFYFGVVEEGFLSAGDRLEPIGGGGSGVSVRDIVRLAFTAEPDRELISRALDLPRLPFFWKERILEQIRR